MGFVFDSDELKKARVNVGLTQVEASAASGIPQTTISSYEKGRTTPTVKAMKCLAEAYQMRQNDLIDLCFKELKEG